MAAGDLVARSVEVIRAGQHESGAYVACPAFAQYRFCWFRDGAFVADAMSAAGEVDSAEAFFDWCSAVVLRRRDELRAGAHLHARYELDGSDTTVEWPTFQLDGPGLWLLALRRHGDRHRRPLDRWRAAADATLDSLAATWRSASVDWWEEQEGMHAATLGSILAGLRAWEHPESVAVARAFDVEADWRLDGSLLALARPLGVLPPDRVPIADVERRLVSPGGGVWRHLADTYYGGGEWVLLTALLGLNRLAAGRDADARDALAWVEAHATADGLLPEQVSDHLLAPERRSYWVERWGEPACPLLWSHAWYLLLALALREHG